MNRRSFHRRTDLARAAGTALGLVLVSDPRENERRSRVRRRDDANSVDHMLASTTDADIVKTFAVGGCERRKSALYACGCVVVDPVAPRAHLQLLECLTHASLRSTLRRRRTDRHTASYTR